MVLYDITYAQRKKKALMPYAKSETPNQPMHSRSLVMAFSVRRHIL